MNSPLSYCLAVHGGYFFQRILLIGPEELSEPGGLIQVDHLLRHLIICDNVGGNKASKACSEVTCRLYSMSSVIIKADILGDPVYCS